MKTVILVRHAKSSWDDPELSDFERLLNKRGLKDAAMMASIINEKGIKPDLIISSPAVRALATAQHFAEAMSYPLDSIRREKAIYEHGPNGTLRILQKLDPDINTVMVFGHNPDFTHLVNFFTNKPFAHMPTCGVVCLDFKTEKFENLDTVKAEMRFFEYPKKYREEK